MRRSMTAHALCCTACIPSQVFESADQRRNHDREYHSSSFTVTVETESGQSKKILVKQVDGVYACPICEKALTTKTGCRKHLKNKNCSVDNKEDESEEYQLPAVIIPERQAIPSPPIPDPKPETRSHDDAVLYSCRQLHASKAEKKRTMGIIHSLELMPFSFKDTLGVEQNALAHASVVAKLSVGQVDVCPIIPHNKRKRVEDEICSKCSPVPVPGLEHLLSTSPYTASLLTRRYVELNDDISELLNRDWHFSPQLRYACSVILAGCILVNNKNGQAVIANTVEVYGRTRVVDAHREPFTVRKGQPVANSLPPSIKTPYKRVWPVTISAPEGERLIIGTKSFNALVTSSLRLDTTMEASVGAITPSFLLSDTNHSLATKIFLDGESVDIGLKLAESKSTWSVSSSDLMYQLRQTKTKFYEASTYYLCRASSNFANSHTCQPYTIFNLSSFDHAPNGDGAAASSIFHTVATNVIRDGLNAMLSKDKVQELRNRCADQGCAANEFDGILTLYRSGKPPLPILGNHDLNKHLENLALLLSTYIAKANRSVVSFITKEFAPPAM